ncbi:MAG: aminodeoxychorismate lyase [Methylophilaceae bacterium 17-44-8]|nr:MAG: aminodeoxychorismate lyase [Methylophilales bacterium 28-44-11]OYZ03586.1 MAG: aminodeoxychorismate lyase [Methylophilales bacterium 16-45-7]OZA06681.1 MAG: aminodeoxychorismate lyase [Methylophilaceae bacterium 17-44-8]
MNRQHTYLINGGVDDAISPLDRGLSYGDGVFRTFKVVDCLPVNWPIQYQKLVSDCGAIGIVCPSAELLMAEIQMLFDLDETAVAKIIITRGLGERGYAPPAVTAPTRILIKSQMPVYPASHFQDGVALYTCRTPVAHQPMLAGIKHLNRLENVLARAECRDPSFIDGVMMDIDGHVIECTSANLFVRIGSHLYTPDLSKAGVAGVTRQRILDIAHYLHLSSEIKVLELQEVLSGDEVVICNSLYGVWQVRRIAEQVWPIGKLASELRELLRL